MKRRRFNDLGQMKACLQSRCSHSELTLSIDNPKTGHAKFQKKRIPSSVSTRRSASVM
jgi:hypothetical protein